MAFSSVLRTNERQKNPLLTFNFQIMMLKLKSGKHQWAGVLFACLCWCMPSEAQKQTSDKPVHDSICLHEVVVSARRQMMGANQVGSQISQTAITDAMGRSLGSLLEGVSGMSSIQTGTIVSKPVIHGMYGNRILMVSNGARLTGQQWGADHAPEVDKNSYSDIEVVKEQMPLNMVLRHLAVSFSCNRRLCPMKSAGFMAWFQPFMARMAGASEHRVMLRAASNGAVTGRGVCI